MYAFAKNMQCFTFITIININESYISLVLSTPLLNTKYPKSISDRFSREKLQLEVTFSPNYFPQSLVKHTKPGREKDNIETNQIVYSGGYSGDIYSRVLQGGTKRRRRIR